MLIYAWKRASRFHECVVLTWWRHQMEPFSGLLAFCAGIHRWPVNFPHKDQWRGALRFSLICTCINGWINIREAGDLRRHHAHYDVIVMGNTPQSWYVNLTWTGFVITLPNVTRCSIPYCKNSSRTWIRLWINKITGELYIAYRI